MASPSFRSPITTTIGSIGEDILQNILTRLPALSFASAACVSRSWNRVSDRVLCRPKLSSACSFNSSLHVAVEEVVNKVLSEPISPHFAIVSIGPSFSLQEALTNSYVNITTKLGSEVPIVTHCSSGVIGRDALSDEFKEFKITDYQHAPSSKTESENRAIMLMVGFLPGMKVKTISLQHEDDNPVAVMTYKFIADVREFSSSVSGRESPAAMIMFTGLNWWSLPDVATIMENIDYAMSPETVIAGESYSAFEHCTGNSTASEEHVPAGVAIVFVMDTNKPSGIGETQFHVVLSCGMLTESPLYEVAFVEELHRAFNLVTANVDLGAVPDGPHSHIGVTKRRVDSIGQERVHLSFYRITGEVGRDQWFVQGFGIKTGDTFRLYRSNPATALSSAANVSNHLKSFKQENGDTREVFGGLLFASCGRGDPFFGVPDVDSSVFLDNFPGVTLGGSFCCSEFARDNFVPYFGGAHEQNPVCCCLCEYSAVYLIMSYTPSK